MTQHAIDHSSLGSAGSLRQHGSKAFAGLEICRFLCALAVVLWHYQSFFDLGIDDGKRGNFAEIAPLHVLFSVFYRYGFFAVAVFWVISGFIFYWKYSDAVHRRTISAERFFVWRFSRLYPLHFATLVAVALMQPIYERLHGTPFVYHGNNVIHFLLQLGMASNWFAGQPYTFNGPIWSVSVEVLAYGIFFIAVVATRPSLMQCALIVIVTKLLMLRGIDWFDDSVLSCVNFFFAGGLVQQALMRLDGGHQKRAFLTAICGVVTLVAAAHEGFPPNRTWLLVFASALVACFALLDAVMPLQVSKLAALGDLTYASYLIHFPIQLATVIMVDEMGISRSLFLSPAALLAFLLVTFGAAFLIYRLFEMPAQDKIRAFWFARRGQLVVSAKAH